MQIFGVLCVVFVLAACGDDGGETAPRNTSGASSTTGSASTGMTTSGETTTGVTPTRELGESCGVEAVCTSGLVCAESGRCEPSGNQSLAEPCVVDDACSEGLQCGERGVCEVEGARREGELCADASDCARGLVCLRNTVIGQCVVQGEGWPGFVCRDTADCAGGLVCNGGLDRDRTCISWGSAKERMFRGFPCEDRGPNDTFRSYFEIPSGVVNEFYRLPFPNDIVARNGAINLSAHTTSGAQSDLGTDLVKVLLDTVSQHQRGFGANQGVSFRFSAGVDLSTLTARGESPTLYMIDLTEGAPTFGRRISIAWETGVQRNLYRCGDWLMVRPAWGRPLTPGHTYGVVLTNGILGEEGQPLLIESDFDTMLRSNAPNDDVRARAWETYAPLRAWLEASQTESSTLRSAAVFTVGDLHKISRRLPEAVRTAQAPQALNWTLCEGEETVSPCAQGAPETKRSCPISRDDASEVHFTFSAPIFQEGTRPYTREGGGFVTDTDGLPQAQGYEDICASMVIPKTPMPEEGWPVILYAHGTGESFRSHADNFAPLVMDFADDDLTTGAIVLGWDQVMHGMRGGSTPLHPTQSVYNYANPRAMRGNFYQSSADIHTLVRWLESFALSADASPTGEPLRIDLDHIYIVGLDQGAHAAALAMPFSARLRLGVFAGLGGGTLLQTLDQREPVDLMRALNTSYQLGELSTDHPVLHILQGWLDPIDPLNTLSAWSNGSVPLDTSIHHALVLLSNDDRHTPRSTQEALATAMRLDIVSPIQDPFTLGGVDEIDAPASGNERVGEEAYTRVCRQYQAGPEEDAHRVHLIPESGARDIAAFLRSAYTQGAPILPE